MCLRFYQSKLTIAYDVLSVFLGKNGIQFLKKSFVSYYNTTFKQTQKQTFSNGIIVHCITAYLITHILLPPLGDHVCSQIF